MYVWPATRLHAAVHHAQVQHMHAHCNQHLGFKLQLRSAEQLLTLQAQASCCAGPQSLAAGRGVN